MAQSGRPPRNPARRDRLLARREMLGRAAADVPGPMMLEMRAHAERERIRVSELVRQAVTEKLLRHDVRQKAQESDADIAMRAFLQKAAEICCSPDELKRAIGALHDEDERNDPELRKYVDGLRRRSKSPRMRARAGRFEPKP